MAVRPQIDALHLQIDDTNVRKKNNNKRKQFRT